MHLPPLDRFKGFIFDCDGTLVDSMPLHYEAWTKLLDEWKCPFPKTLFYDWAGVPTDEILARLNAKFSLEIKIKPASQRREELFLTLLSKLKPIPEVLTLVEKLHPKFPLAVASGGKRETIHKTLAALDLNRYFKVHVTSEDYAQGKPHPDVFLIAAKRLGLEPQDCLVFEDAELGFQAAEAAGMAYVKVPVKERAP